MTTATPFDATRVWLQRGSLAAGIAFTATAEYDLARSLGAHLVIAAMLPLAIDAYVVAALRWFRAFDITLSLTLMGAAQVAAHLLDAHVMKVNIPMVVVVSLLVPVALWRTHALARSEADVTTTAPAVCTTPVVTEVAAVLDPLPDAWDPDVTTGATSKVTTSLPASTPRKVVTEVITVTPAELRKRALKLHREVVAETGRPVTTDRLRTELGLSRREAAALWRDVVKGKRS